jgi:succinate dehydrogenase / fumarate reductase flavoprotein subunit
MPIRRCRACQVSLRPASAPPASTAQTAAQYARTHKGGVIDTRQADEAAKAALEPFERGSSGEGPYQVQYALQEMMQDLVGIVRNEGEMRKALDAIQELRERARRVGIGGHREYNPGWHAALDLPNLLIVSEAITLSALERHESRGGHFREDYPNKDQKFGSFNFVVRKGSDGEMVVLRAPIPEMPEDLKRIIEEMQ